MEVVLLTLGRVSQENNTIQNAIHYFWNAFDVSIFCLLGSKPLIEPHDKQTTHWAFLLTDGVSVFTVTDNLSYTSHQVSPLDLEGIEIIGIE